MILWLTGNSKSGKTTLANRLIKNTNYFWLKLDGDEMRKSISVGASFSKKDRHEHNIKIAKLAKQLHKQCNIIVSCIAPLQKTRNEIYKICKCTFIYLKNNKKLPKEYIYEEPTKYITINTSKLNINKSIEKINEIINDYH